MRRELTQMRYLHTSLHSTGLLETFHSNYRTLKAILFPAKSILNELLPQLMDFQMTSRRKTESEDFSQLFSRTETAIQW